MVALRRSTFEILADILRFGEASRRKILYGSDIRSDLLDKYLSLLTERGLVSVTRKGNQKIYRTTKEGENFVRQVDEAYRRLGKWNSE